MVPARGVALGQQKSTQGAQGAHLEGVPVACSLGEAEQEQGQGLVALTMEVLAEPMAEMCIADLCLEEVHDCDC
mgnify:CR=1 FL=1